MKIHSAFSYAPVLTSATPTGYICGTCGAEHVRLYREYQTFLEHQRLHCTACAIKDQEAERALSDKRYVEGCLGDVRVASKLYDPYKPHAIGWLVLAVPSEEGDTYYGFSSVPEDGLAWWMRLPIAFPSKVEPKL